MDESGCSYIELQETDGHNKDTMAEDNPLTGKCLELEMEDGKVIKCRVKSVTKQRKVTFEYTSDNGLNDDAEKISSLFPECMYDIMSIVICYF